MKLMRESYRTLLVILAVAFCALFAPLAPQAWAGPPADRADIDAAVTAADSNSDSDLTWDTGGGTVNFVDKLRGLATVLLMIALVVAALVAGMTGRTTMSIFVAVGGVVLFGGFWLVLLVVENLSAPIGSSENVVYDTSMINYPSPISQIVKDFIGYGINMLTTATMPFLMIYGFWLSLGVASGTGGDTAGQIKNYVLGGTVAIGAAIFTQIFFRWT
jgi:hypothetical protein